MYVCMFPVLTQHRAFFEKHGHFGLDPQDVVFFPQGTMPCFALDGKLLLDGPGAFVCAFMFL